ncbi:serine/threonine-protein kinase PknH/PknJ [Mycobacterium pseudoshottsii]|nr:MULTISPECIES: serine/threonine-protein kinase PknH/PknJ [Mycobacterium ulcerans group]
MSLAVGETFAAYTIVRLLGSGGMGEVYLAQHPRLPRRDALKVMDRSVSAEPGFRERFLREADLASALWHPHIVGVHDRGEYRGQLWISMDFVDGEDCGRLIERRYPAGMPQEMAIAVVEAVASALDYAHNQGLLHRDVKPANIMLANIDDHEQRRVLLTDFGIARECNDISGLTTTNMAVGTVAYCAPEQLMGADVDSRADQYALAATAYHLLSGMTLFPHLNPAVVISHHLNADPPRLAEVRAELELDQALAKALAKNPHDRYARCADFAHALARLATPSNAALMQGGPTIPTQVGREPASSAAETPETAAARNPWRRLIAPAAAAAVLLVVAGTGLALHTWNSDESSSKPSTNSNSQVASDPAITSIPSASAAQPSIATNPQLFPPRTADDVLLTAAELSSLLGIKVTTDPNRGIDMLAMDSSAYGLSDHSRQVDPASCVGVAFTGEHQMYSDTDVEEVKTQSFSQKNWIPGSQGGPQLLQQTVAVFPSAESAQRFLASTQTQWNACTNATDPTAPSPFYNVGVTLGYENSRGFKLGNVKRSGDLITVSMASNGGLNGPDACQQAMGLQQNIIAEVRTCQIPSVQSRPGDAPNPAWAIPDAQRVARAILDKIGDS